jgi:hypothetical protein
MWYSRASRGVFSTPAKITKAQVKYESRVPQNLRNNESDWAGIPLTIGQDDQKLRFGSVALRLNKYLTNPKANIPVQFDSLFLRFCGRIEYCTWSGSGRSRSWCIGPEVTLLEHVDPLITPPIALLSWDKLPGHVWTGPNHDEHCAKLQPRVNHPPLQPDERPGIESASFISANQWLLFSVLCD